MATYLVRVALPDRPGALGAVASRIGAVRADVIAVEIVERRQGSAIDEFVVELADEGRLTLLLSEVAEVDGVSVETVHPISGRGHDRRLDAYDTALGMIRERTPQGVLAALASRVATELDAAWTAVVDVEAVTIVASHGRPPAAAWLAALVVDSRAATAAAGGDEGEGTRALPDQRAATEPVGRGRTADAPAHLRPEATDIGWVDLAAWDLVLAAGRPGWRFGSRERAHLAAVARLADARWTDLAESDSRTSHPTRAG